MFYSSVSKEGFVFLKFSVTTKGYKVQQVQQVRTAVSEESLNYHSGKTCRSLWVEQLDPFSKIVFSSVKRIAKSSGMLLIILGSQKDYLGGR